jgi:hypothetical protein
MMLIWRSTVLHMSAGRANLYGWTSLPKRGSLNLCRRVRAAVARCKTDGGGQEINRVSGGMLRRWHIVDLDFLIPMHVMILPNGLNLSITIIH